MACPLMAERDMKLTWAPGIPGPDPHSETNDAIEQADHACHSPKPDTVKKLVQAAACFDRCHLLVDSSNGRLPCVSVGAQTQAGRYLRAIAGGRSWGTGSPTDSHVPSLALCSDGLGPLDSCTPAGPSTN